MSTLARDLFASHVGSTFHVQAGAATVDLTLAFVSELRSSARTEAFSIEFRGPVTDTLPQGEYRFEHPEIGDFTLFVVPVGRVDHELEYEAVFNRVLPMS